MRQKVIVLAASLLAFGLTLGAPPEQGSAKQNADAPKDSAKKDEAPKEDAGRLVYDSSRCYMCHAIDGKGNKKTPLDGVGTKLTADQIRKWIVSPKQMKPDTMMRSFSGLSKEDLDALVTYLSGLKKKGK